MTVEEQNLRIDGLPIRYLSAGEGPSLVLLHGAGDNALDSRDGGSLSWLARIASSGANGVALRAPGRGCRDRDGLPKL